MTSKKLGIALLSLVVLAIFAVAPVAAIPSSTANVFAHNITSGDTVFVGESGLNITDALAGATKIAWYAPGTDKTTSAPDYQIDLTGVATEKFYISDFEFGTRSGAWYAYFDVLNPATVVFTVAQPSLKIDLLRDDGKTSVDGKKLIADDGMKMRIDSTFSQLFKRAYTEANNNTVLYDFWYDFPLDESDLYIPYEDGQGIRGATDDFNDTVKHFLDLEYEYVVVLNSTVPGINAYAKTPNGATLTSLITVEGDGEIDDIISLQKLHPDVSNFMVYFGYDVWDAGRVVDEEDKLKSKILSGEYQFYADINVNGIKDNLGEISGKTRSNTATVTIDKESVTITADKETVIRNNGFSVKVEGTPKKYYTVWITGVSGYNYYEVPAFIQNQKDVISMNWTMAWNTTYKTAGVIGSDLPKGLSFTNDYTGNYAVVAQLSAGGSINIGLITNENTSDKSYTIRAQRIENNVIDPSLPGYVYDGFGRANGYKLDKQLYDTVKVKVEKGAVTVSASGDGSYYLGEEVTLSGTNTDSDDIYLIITGPNLDPNGGVLEAPKTKPNYERMDYTHVNVKTDDTWEFKWDTSGSILDAGTYTIYATSAFALKNDLSDDVKYDTVSVVIKKPFVTATTSASTVAKGDKLYIRGTAEGNPTQGVAVWILGKNYWNGEDKNDLWKSKMAVETVNDDGSFEFELGSGDTKNLASGQYFVVVQHPMYNGEFDVKTQPNEKDERLELSSSIQVITNPKGTNTGEVNGVAFIVAGANKLQGSDAAEALIQAINSANIDDTYTKLTFLVEEPWIRVNSVGDHYIGDQFKITGTTNLAVGDNLIVEVTSSSFQPTQKTQSGEFSGVSSTVKVNEGSSYNEWAMDVDASTFKADEYIVNVEAIEADVTTTTTFNILTGSATVAPTTAPTSAPTTAPTSAPTTAPTPAATASPGFGALVALIGLGAVAALIIRKD